MARSDMFLKLTGQRTGEIQGESNDKVFPNQIELLGWSWGMVAPTSVGGQRSGRTQVRELKIVKSADRASTALMRVLETNETLKAVLTVRKAGGAALPYFVATLEKARISEYAVQSVVDPSGAPTLMEHISLTFQRMTVDYTPQTATGSGGGGSSCVIDVAAHT